MGFHDALDFSFQFNIRLRRGYSGQSLRRSTIPQFNNFTAQQPYIMIEKKHYRCYINGEWMDSKSGQNIEVENPATGEVFATVATSTKAEAQ